MIDRKIQCEVALAGWRLHFAQMDPREREMGSVMQVAAKGAISRVAKRFPLGRLDENPTIQAVREMLARHGVDWQVTPANSERIVQRIVKDKSFPAGELAWQFLVLLTINSLAPWSLLDPNRLAGPLVFRAGQKGEVVPGGQANSDCFNRPVLADANGVVGAPWWLEVGDEAVNPQSPLFVCYMPESHARQINPKAHIGRLVWMTWAYTFAYEKAFAPA